MQKFGKFCLENANSWHFDVEISLAKGIIFRKIGLANGAILKQWAAHPSPKFSREPPPRAQLLANLSILKEALIFCRNCAKRHQGIKVNSLDLANDSHSSVV